MCTAAVGKLRNRIMLNDADQLEGAVPYDQHHQKLLG